MYQCQRERYEYRWTAAPVKSIHFQHKHAREAASAARQDPLSDQPFPDLPPHNAAAFGVALDAHMLIKDMQGCFLGLSIRRTAAFSGVPALPPCRFVIHINESNQASNQIRASSSFIFLFSVSACDSAALITEMHINGRQE